MVSVMQAAFEQGRMPIFEAVETLDSEQKLQMTHLSFQELMTGEYSSAIVRHAHANRKTRAYINFFLSNSAKSLDRDRLSENWWLQVWFHVCEMLEPDAFEEWCASLAEDERAKVFNGSITWQYEHNVFNPCSLLGKRSVRPWEFGGIPLQASEVDHEQGTCRLAYVPTNCHQKYSYAKPRNKLLNKMLFGLCEVQPYTNGVAMILRHATVLPHLAVMGELLKRRVHYGAIDEDGQHAWFAATSNNKTSAVKLMMDYRAEQCFENVTVMGKHYASKFRPFDFAAMRDMLHGFTGQRNMARAKSYGILEQARTGTLDVSGEIDPNFSDPQTGMTPLMFAAAAGQTELVRELITLKASVDAENYDGATALTFAVEHARGRTALECMELLIDAGADVNHKAGKVYNGRFLDEWGGRGCPLAHSLCWVASEPEKLDLLIKSGYDVNLTNDYGLLPVHFTAISTDIPMLQKLLDAKSQFHDAYAPYCAKVDQNPTGWSHHPQGWNYWQHWRNFQKYSCVSENLWWNASLKYMNFAIEKGYNPTGGFEVPAGNFTFTNYLMAAMNDVELNTSGDTSMLKMFMEHKQDINAETCLLGARLPWAHVLWSVGPSGLTFMFDHKGDLDHKEGPFGILGNAHQLAKASSNQIFMDTYDDWVQLQNVNMSL
jgi:ankyrin repeat protein